MAVLHWISVLLIILSTIVITLGVAISVLKYVNEHGDFMVYIKTGDQDERVLLDSRIPEQQIRVTVKLRI